VSFETADATVRELYPYANDLARSLGVAYPKDNDSPGAKWLLTVRDHFAEDADRILSADYPFDEIEWDALEYNTYQQWLIFADLELWSFDADVTFSEHADFAARNFRTESHAAIKASELPSLAQNIMAELANNLGHLIIQELQTVLVEAESELLGEDE
jgi:hypothetical protein